MIISKLECFPDTNYLTCSMRLINNSHVDIDVGIKRTLYQPALLLSVTQVTKVPKANTRKSVILRRKFEFCNEATFGMTDYISRFILYAASALLNGSKLACPVHPRNFSIRCFTLTLKMIPFHLFYKPNSYLIVNGTYLETNQKSKLNLGYYLIHLTIEKRVRKNQWDGVTSRKSEARCFL